MRFEKRKRFIVEKLKATEQVEVVDIVDAFQVSAITARRDLIQLEKEGLLVRTHGGAIISQQQTSKKKLFSYDEKVVINRERKEYIAKLAMGLIDDGDVIFIDSGSTLFNLAAHLKDFNNLTVITNSLPVASELLGHPNIRNNLVGGEIDHER